MEKEFRTTRGFEKDLDGLGQEDRERIKKKINAIVGLALKDSAEFRKRVERPYGSLPGGLQSSLYVLTVSNKLRLLFALDEDPIFGRMNITLFRAVPVDALEDACRTTAEVLYGRNVVNGAEKVTTPRKTSRG
jgi:hypothetical protein